MSSRLLESVKNHLLYRHVVIICSAAVEPKDMGVPQSGPLNVAWRERTREKVCSWQWRQHCELHHDKCKESHATVVNERKGSVAK